MEGLREIAALVEKGDPVIPSSDVAVVLRDSLLRALIAAQLPLEADIDEYRVTLTAADVVFRGSPQVRLRGTVAAHDRPELKGEVSLIGALQEIAIDHASGTLRASVGVDHLEIEKAAGLEKLLSQAALDELARTLRLEITDRIPPLTIPVKVQERIPLPAVTDGPVRIEAAEMPLQAGVSRVIAAQGRLWIGINLRAGEVARSAPAPGGAR